MRIKALFSLAVLGYAGLALAQTTVVEEKKSEVVTVVVKETPKPPAFVFELHGFVSTTGYFQDQNFSVGNGGQAALFSASPNKYLDDKPLFGFDIRQTRLNFSVRGPQVMGGAVPKAVVELDFFGSSEFAGTGAFGDVSVLPRLRVAYIELNWGEGRHILQIGQQNMLTIGTIPQSLSHIAFPWTYTAGTVGWRQPGLWGWHTFGDDLKFEFAWSVQKAGWANTVAHGGINDGVSSGLPAFEARGTLKFGKMLDVWLSGHWQTVDTTGPGVIAGQNQNSDLQTVLGTVGFKGTLGPVALAGSFWYGKNAGPLLGNVLQFTPMLPTDLTSYRVDIFGYGVWAQAGMNLTKNISGWVGYGIDHPVYENIYQAFGSAAARLRNQNLMAMIRYQEGGFAFGGEWLYNRTTWTTGDSPVCGNQISLTANYYF